jgi:hypothetical protein
VRLDRVTRLSGTHAKTVKPDTMEKRIDPFLAQSNRVPAETAVELILELEAARDALIKGRGSARIELLRAIGSTGVAGLLLGIEAWATWRGEPAFGWLVFVIFIGFAGYFWSRRLRAEKATRSLDEALRLLEAKWSDVSGSGRGNHLASPPGPEADPSNEPVAKEEPGDGSLLNKRLNLSG